MLPEVQWVELCSRNLRRTFNIDPQLDDATTVDTSRDVLTAGEFGAPGNRGRPQAVGTLHGVVSVPIPSCGDWFVVNVGKSRSERRSSG